MQKRRVSIEHPGVRQARVFHVTLLALILLSNGCVSRKPLRAIAVEQRENSQVFYVGDATKLRNSTVGTRGTREAGMSGGVIGGIMMVVAGAIESKGGDWMAKIREQTGEFEADLLLEKVTSELRELQPDSSSAGGDRTPVLEISFSQIGIPELQRDWYGAYGLARARLRDHTDQEVWSAQASSTSTKLRRRAEFEVNPSLYQADFADVAEDIARQLVDGPIRSLKGI